jgi:hypothetical protein
LTHRGLWEQLIDHVFRSVLDGSLPPTGGTLIRLFQAEEVQVEVDTALAIAGDAGVVDGPAGLLSIGERYLSRQTAALGGGSTEMARNVIGERILGFPRELAADRGVPFNQVKHGRS